MLGGEPQFASHGGPSAERTIGLPYKTNVNIGETLGGCWQSPQIVMDNPATREAKGRRCCGSSNRWIVTMREMEINLLNPLPRNNLTSPPSLHLVNMAMMISPMSCYMKSTPKKKHLAYSLRRPYLYVVRMHLNAEWWLSLQQRLTFRLFLLVPRYRWIHLPLSYSPW